MANHFNCRSTRTIWFSKIFIFSKIDKIFSCRIALEINNRPGYYSRQFDILQYSSIQFLILLIVDELTVLQSAEYENLVDCVKTSPIPLNRWEVRSKTLPRLPHERCLTNRISKYDNKPPGKYRRNSLVRTHELRISWTNFEVRWCSS